VLAALKSALESASTEGKPGDVLVLSNLWTAG
jgi:hypothetical protein